MSTGIGSVTNLVDLLRERARRQPADRAFTFLADGEREEARLSFAELDEAARRIAGRLQAEDARGERVLLLYPPGLDYIAAFFGCLYAGAISVPVYPPDPHRMARELPRLRTIAADARAGLALTTASIRGLAGSMADLAPELGALRWIASDGGGDGDDDAVSADNAAAWRPPAVSGDTVAFLQYTSGSTGAPKGVVLSHGNLVANQAMIRDGFGHGPGLVVLGWLPLYHDMGLIGNVLQPIYMGAPCVLMSPAAFLSRPLRWLRAISEHRATTSGGPNFAYDLCVRKTTPEERASLDLGCWEVAFCGAEPVRADTLERFAEAFAPAGFRREALYPCYGLAEASLIVTGGQKSAGPVVVTREDSATRPAPTRSLVGCGSALGEERVIVVEPVTGRRCDRGVDGEIWIAGPNVAAGYWGRPDLTDEIFAAFTADGDGPYLRSGDLGFVDPRGELFVTGRRKDLVIIRGRNHAPQDLELTVERSHPALRPGCGVATAIDGEDGEQLVVVQEVRAGAEPGADIVAGILAALSSEHDLRPASVVLVEAGTIPKTSSGKIQRHACRAALQAGQLAVLHQWHERGSHPANAGDGADRSLDAELTARIAAILRLPVAQVDPEVPLARHGMDSLAALEVQALLEEELGVRAPLAEITGEGTISSLLARGGRRASRTAATPSPADADAPLTHGQRGLWLLQTRAPASTAYNVSHAFRVLGHIDGGALGRAVTRLTARHPALRTIYPLVAGEPVARALPARPIAIEIEEVAGQRELARRLDEEARRPFSLADAPPLRLRLMRGAGETVLVLVVHHIACDLWSLSIVADELGRLYAEECGGPAADLAEPAATMAGHARRQRDRLAGEGGAHLVERARRRLQGAPAALDLATDRPRPAIADERGAALAFGLDRQLMTAVRRVAGEQRASVHAVLLAGYAALLRAHGGQDDLLIASPAANRSRSADQGVVGFLVNPVVIRASVAGRPTFAELVARVQRRTLEALEEQELPLPLLIESLGASGDASGVPLVQVAFAYQRGRSAEPSPLARLAAGARDVAVDIGPLRLVSRAVATTTAQFDLALVTAEGDGDAGATLFYRTALYDAETIACLAEQLVGFLRSACDAPERPVADISLVSSREQKPDGRPAAAAVVPHGAAHELFERQVARAPGATAIVSAGGVLSYAELDRRSGRLAGRLRALGAGPESTVAARLAPGSASVTAMLACWKAGACFAPIDPALSPPRAARVIAGLGASVLLAPSADQGVTGDWTLLPMDEALDEALDDARESQDAGDQDRVRSPSLPDVAPSPASPALALCQLSYAGDDDVVAVVVDHAALSAALRIEELSIDSASRVLASAPAGSDIAVWEAMLALSSGASLLVAPAARDRAAVATDAADLIERWRPTHAVATPLVRELLTARPQLPLATILLGAEPLTAAQASRWGGGRRLLYLHGAPEAGLAISVGAADGGGARRPCGVAVAGASLYVLDAEQRPAPIGVAGELYVGGTSLAAGYHRRPALTAERFAPDPFAARPGARMVRTGERARRRADGRIELLGGAGQQLHARGFRIEPASIEGIVLHDPSVSDVAVVTSSSAGAPALAAYIVPVGPAGPVALAERRDELRVELAAGVRVTSAERRAPISSTAADVSAAGVRLVGLSEPLTRGERVKVDSADGALAGSLDAVVVWSTADAAGLAFDDRPEALAALEPLVAQAARARSPGLGRMLQSSRRALPGHLMPASWRIVGRIPRTARGTVDRGALAALRGVPLDASPAAARTRGPTVEQEICAAWQELLGVPEVTAGSNFFDLGGHSLLAIRLTTRIRDRFGVEISVAEMFRDPTPAAVARLVEDRMPARGAGAAEHGQDPAPGELIEQLCGLWAELLGVPVQPDTSFFDAGGHSLLAIRMTTRLRELHGVELSVAEIFKDPTVDGLARLIEARRPPAETGPELLTRELCALWEELLGTAVEPDTNFFDAGGHSLLAIRITTRIRDLHGVELSVAEIFKDPTVNGLAQLIADRRAGEPSAEEPALEPVSRAGLLVDPEPTGRS